MRSKTTLWTGVLVAMTVAALIVVQYREAGAQNPNQGSAPVTIVNPLPLPVTGTVSTADAGIPVHFDIDTTSSSSRYTVPIDQRLTIEFVSVSCLGKAPATPRAYARIQTRIGINDGQPALPADFVAETFGLTEYSGAMTVRIYADPGTEVRLTGRSTGTTHCFVTAYGLLSPA